MKPLRIQNVFIVLLCFVSIAAQTPGPGSKWVLTWSDEFNAPDGTPVDSGKWTAATGGHGWGNHELEYYTTSTRNAHQEHGSLVIEAIQEPYTGADGVS